MTKGLKTTLISCGVILAIALAIFAFIIGIKNTALSLDESLQSSRSAISIQEKRRVDLISNLVDTAEQFMKRQNETLTDVTAMRQSLASGDIASAQLSIQALTENYPQIAGEGNYKQLMTEMTATENLIADHRNAFNTSARAYNTYIKKFPNSLFLSGRTPYNYLTIDAPQDAPQNLYE